MKSIFFVFTALCLAGGVAARTGVVINGVTWANRAVLSPTWKTVVFITPSSRPKIPVPQDSVYRLGMKSGNWSTPKTGGQQ